MIPILPIGLSSAMKMAKDDEASNARMNDLSNRGFKYDYNKVYSGSSSSSIDSSSDSITYKPVIIACIIFSFLFICLYYLSAKYHLYK